MPIDDGTAMLTGRLFQVMTKRKNADTTVPPISADFEDTLKALLRTPPPPKKQ